MKTEKYINDIGEFRCFGFPNSLVGKSGVKEILSRIAGTKITYWNKHWGAEVFCEFDYKGQKFEVSEPYGDNSYYDILCNEPNTPELEEIHEVFSSTQVPTRKTYTKIVVFVVILVSIIMALKIYGSR